MNEPKTLTMSHEQQQQYQGGFFNHHYEYPYWQNHEMEQPPSSQFHHQQYHVPTNTFPMVPFNASSASFPDQHVFYNNASTAAVSASPSHEQFVDASDNINLDLTLHL
jgi:hypothetical protein